jgi:maltooligosyltrehalose trehalohydrolase
MPTRRLPIGAEVQLPEGAHFRVWAPKRQRVEVVLDAERGAVELQREEHGYFAGFAPEARAGTRYRFRLDGEKQLYPDPASRFQPEGPHGPSELIDPIYRWTDSAWRGIGAKGRVVYEMHIGTFTQAGTWAGAIEQLPALAELGITVLEVMPLADFAGRFGWGYDGVNLFAPTRLYGRPDDVRRFVDRAHALGLGVILDVVYNHFGPDGNYLKQFAEHYFSSRYTTEWGEALNFDGADCEPVREFFIANARYWIDEYHFDGLRLDATQQIYDASAEHILVPIGRAVREAAAGKATYIVAENEPQETRLVRSCDQGGYGLDALWNDDFHHSALVALTGHNEAYYSDYLGTPQEFISALKWGYLYQGQRYSWQEKRRGTPALDLPPDHFVSFIQNHDQIANTGRGVRCQFLTSSGRLKALTALTLLGPATPMLFQGQEFASSSPFHYFADHEPALAKLVFQGRVEFMHQFPTLRSSASNALVPDPADPRTFEHCKLNFAERAHHVEAYALHRDLLELRRTDPAFRAQRYRGIDGAVLSEQAFVVRFFLEDGADRLLLINLGRDLWLDPAPEPLLAPPAGKEWHLAWSSEAIEYGGCGTAPLDTDENWRIPGEAAVILKPGAPLITVTNPQTAYSLSKKSGKKP